MYDNYRTSTCSTRGCREGIGGGKGADTSLCMYIQNSRLAATVQSAHACVLSSQKFVSRSLALSILCQLCQLLLDFGQLAGQGSDLPL